MYKTIRLPTSTIYVSYAGLGSGVNYSRTFNPTNADANIEMLRHPAGSKSSTRIVPNGNYEAYVSPAQGDVNIDSAAIVSNHFNDVLVLLPADCIPIVLGARRHPALCALIHGGRRELDADIIAKTIRLIQTHFGNQSAELVAYLGPGIKQQSYRLPREVEATLHHSGWEHFITNDEESYVHLDTFGFARNELRRLGVPSNSIIESNVDTMSNERYYSYYGQTRYGQAGGTNGCTVIMKPTKGAY